MLEIYNLKCRKQIIRQSFSQFCDQYQKKNAKTYDIYRSQCKLYFSAVLLPSS
jgi:hypothetical protein